MKSVGTQYLRLAELLLSFSGFTVIACLVLSVIGCCCGAAIEQCCSEGCGRRRRKKGYASVNIV